MTQVAYNKFGQIEAVIDGKTWVVPADPGNSDYQRILASGVIITPYVPVATKADVDAERDRRLDLGVVYNGKAYQTRDVDIQNITGACLAATLYIVNGGDPNSARWANPNADFQWIATDNTLATMTAAQMIAFGQVAIANVSRLYLKARSIKDSITNGAVINDVQANYLWS